MTEGLTYEPPFSVQVTNFVSQQVSMGGNSATNLARKSDNFPLFHHEKSPLEGVTRITLLRHEFPH